MNNDRTGQATYAGQQNPTRSWIAYLGLYSSFLPAFSVETHLWGEGRTDFRQTFSSWFLQYHNKCRQEQAEGNMNILRTSRNNAALAGRIKYECLSKAEEFKHFQ